MSELAAQWAEKIPETTGQGPAWLEKLRSSAAVQFRTHGLPDRKDEAWKYTGLRMLDKSGVQLATESKPGTSDSSNPKPLVDYDLVINMLGGQFLEQIGDLPAGLTILPMADAIRRKAPGLKDMLGSLNMSRSKKASSDGFSALNSAMLGNGLFIHVDKGVDAGSFCINWATHATDDPLLFNSRICVIVEEGARLELLEQFESLHDNANSSNIVFQAKVSAGASLVHTRFQDESDSAAVFTRTEVAQAADSEYTYFGFDLGGGLVRHDLHSDLLGEGAQVALNGAYLLNGHRHVDNHARVDHKAPGGSSNQYFRGVAGGDGRAVFNTAVCVHPGADGTEARQSNGNILLSERAVVNTKPELEIYADEVVANHGATVGQLDEQAVFYLQTRGLSDADARQMLTAAFCRSVSDMLSNRALGDVIAERMMVVMPHAG